MASALPPLDHIARALLANGAREHALALLEAVCRRGGPDAARCAALRSAVMARPHERPSGPTLPLDGALVEALAAAGLLMEARAVARGAGLARTAHADLAAALERVLEEPPESLPAATRGRWLEGIAGSVAVLEALEHDPNAREAWVGLRVPLALRLLRGWSVHAPTAVASPGDRRAAPPLPEPLRAALEARVAARDLPGALADLRAAAHGDPALAELVAALARLVAATERLLEEGDTTSNASTVPLGGHGLALFQLRMGNLADAEGSFRRLAMERAGDTLARERLADVMALRCAIDPEAAGARIPDAHAHAAPAAGVLDKNRTRPGGSGWAAGTAKQAASPPQDEWDRDIETNVMKPEQEAELLLRSGQADRALEILRRLAARHPDRPEFAARAREVEAMIDARMAPLPGEHTVRRDISALRRQAQGSLGSLADAETEPPPPPLRASPADADPLAQTATAAPAPRAAQGLVPSPAPPDAAVAVHRIVRVG